MENLLKEDFYDIFPHGMSFHCYHWYLNNRRMSPYKGIISLYPVDHCENFSHDVYRNRGKSNYSEGYEESVSLILEM